MKLILQRASKGAVHIDGQPVASIGNGLVVLVGFGKEDHLEMVNTPVWQTLLNKMLELRIFPDATGKMNLSLRDFGGELLLVSQFTLYADCRKGRRPSFTNACPPETAAKLFNRLVKDVSTLLPQKVQCGKFGAMMDVSLTNWGPVTISLSSDTFQ